MKLLKYIWRNVTRNKLRSLLTIMSVAFSLALMTVLYGFLSVQGVIEREAKKHDRIVVLNKMGFAAPLPIAHMEKIKKMDGVVTATPFSWFGGNYEDRRADFAQFSVDPETYFEVNSEVVIPKDQLVAFKSTQNGCVVDKLLAETKNWQVGDRIPLQGTIYQVDLDLEIVGIYRGPANSGSVYFNWYYLDELLKAANSFSGNAGSIQVKCKVSNEVPVMCEEIDAKFANSENPTKTRTEAAFSKMFTDMLGDVQAYIRYISLAVVFALTLVTATAMAMSMRERTTEVAVLKAIGFSKNRVLSMVLGESFLIASLGGVLGIIGGLGILQMASSVPMAAMMFPFPVAQLIGPWIFGLVGVAGVIGIVSGLVPALRAANISVVDGLRQVV
jgi:putative ABC transport system permease protein